MSKIPLENASPTQLRHHAGVVMGLDVSPNNNSAQLIAKIRAADPALAEIEVTEDEPAKIENRPAPATPAAADGEAVLGTSYHHDPKVTLSIPSTNDKGGDRDVQVAVNGDTILIRRNVPVPVPFRFYEALRMAKENQMSQTQARPGEPARIIEREVMAYPFQVEEMPPAHEVAAYRKRTDNVDNP